MLNHSVVHFLAFDDKPKVIPISFHTPNELNKMEKLEVLFNRTNSPQGEVGIIQDLGLGEWEGRSMSVGDVVFLEGFCFLTCTVGFSPITPDEYREYISCETMAARMKWVREFECTHIQNMKIGESVEKPHE